MSFWHVTTSGGEHPGIVDHTLAKKAPVKLVGVLRKPSVGLPRGRATSPNGATAGLAPGATRNVHPCGRGEYR